MRRFRFPLFAAVVVVGWAGCGPAGPNAHVSGSVTFDGKPVKTGVVTFIPANGGKSGVAAITDGKFDTSVPPNRGLTGGPVTISVSGQGDPEGEFLGGKPLFAEYMEKATIPEGKTTKDIAVPKTASVEAVAKQEQIQRSAGP